MTVDCWPAEDGWQCHVQVGPPGEARQHDVTVTVTELDRLAPAGTPVEELVRQSFRFLLDREPREAILRHFEISVIARYFPDYETEIRRRLE